MSIKERLGDAIGAIIGIVLGITIFVSIDTTPATAINYEPLEKQMTAIQQKPDLLLKTNCNISISDDVITVSFSNDECKLTAQYDQNFEVLSISKEDNYTFWLYALIAALTAGFTTYIIVNLVITIVIFLFEILWEFICNRLKSIKSKKA